MLPRGQVRRHEASLKRRLIRYLVAYGLLILGFILRQEGVVLVGLISVYVMGWGLFMFMWKDVEMHGRSGIWAFVLGSTPAGLLVWLWWRKRHPLRSP